MGRLVQRGGVVVKLSAEYKPSGVEWLVRCQYIGT